VHKVGGLDDAVWQAPPEAEPEPRIGRSGRAALIVVAAVLVLTAYPVTAAVLSRKDYGTFAFWKLPSRIDYCGRRYYDGGPQTENPVVIASKDSPADAHWSRLSWTFSGRSIYGDVFRPTGVSGVCATALFIPLGGGRWEAYGLSGGG
jgi:hypothetical protein